MIINKIEIEGYSSYKNKTTLYPNEGISCIIGKYITNELKSNGTGKSSLIMSILYALYGEGEYTTLSELVCDNSTNMYVNIEFELNSNIYIVERGIKKKSTYLDFTENGNRLGNDVKTTQDEINNILGMDYGMMSSSIFFEQGHLDKFITTAPEERRKFIDKSLGLENWRVLHKEAFKIAKEYNSELVTTVEKLEATKEKITELHVELSLKDKIQSDLEDTTNKKQDIENKRSMLENYFRNIKTQNSLRESLENINKYINTYEEIYENLSKKIKDSKEKIKNYNSSLEELLQYNVEDKISDINKNLITDTNTRNKFIADKDILISTISELKYKISQVSMLDDSKSFCDACKQTIPHEHIKDFNLKQENELKELQDILNTESSNLIKINEQIKNTEDKIKEGNTSLEKFRIEKESISNAIVNTNKEINSETKTLNNNIEELKLTNENIKDQQLKKANIEMELEAISSVISTTNNISEDEETLSKELENLNNKIITLNINYGKILKAEELKESLEDEVIFLAAKKLELEKYVAINNTNSAIFKSIPDGIYNESLSLIEDESNKFLNMILPEFSTHIYEDDSKKSKPLLINFKKNGINRSFKRLSGGEKAIVSLCLRLAMSLVIMERSETKIQFIVLDEPFGALDNENRALVKGVLRLFEENFKQIFLISHTEDIYDFPNIINVYKDAEDNSYIGE